MRLHLGVGVSLIVLMLAVPAFAAGIDPCVLAYPHENAVFQFDPDRYEMIYEGDSLYDPDYGRFGVMLWDKEKGRIAYELYQAPNLVGFQPSPGRVNAFDLPINKLRLYVDGFHECPRQLNDIYVLFVPTPPNAEPIIYVNGEKLESSYYYIATLGVSTPTANGFFSDRIELDVVWSGALAMKVVVFADKNRNKLFDGEVDYSVFMMDQTIPTERTTWGGIKALYR